MRPGQDRSFHPRRGLAFLLTLLALVSLPAVVAAEPIPVTTRPSATPAAGNSMTAVTVANFSATNGSSPSVTAAEAERPPHPMHCGYPPPGVPEPGAASLAFSALGALWVARNIRKATRAVVQR